MDPKSMKVTKLKSILKSKGASTAGNKEALIKRVNELMQPVKVKVERNEIGEQVENASVPPTEPTPEPAVQSTSLESVEPLDEPVKTDDKEVSSNGISLKRKSSSEEISPNKKIKESPHPKTPSAILNELQPGIPYTMVHENMTPPWFVYEVEFRGGTFRGSGISKKTAKHGAATAALESVIQFREPDKVFPYVNTLEPEQMDFTSDTAEGAKMTPFFETIDHFTPTVQSQQNKRVKSVILNDSEKIGQHPIMYLNQLVPGLKYEIVSEKPGYTIEVAVNGTAYQGYGKSKKIARAGAAIKALRNEFNIMTSAPGLETVPSNVEAGDVAPVVSNNLPDLVFTLVRNKFNEQVASCTRSVSKYKVLAGIVMTIDSDTEGEVISLATGTKCISGEYISDQGSALFDCHAEIVCRRGLKRFLYEQLLALSNDECTVLEPCDEGGFRVKNGVEFHLYINTAPCGDSRLFAPSESAAAANDNHPNRRSRGQLRTKIENGEGTIPVDSTDLVRERGKANVQQTWDAVISGERLLTMSCSDKIAKWNILGVQGSLLSLFIQPTYLSSIILGSLFHCQHLQRGVFIRAKDAIESSIAVLDGPGLCPPFRIHRPALAAVPHQKRREAKKAPTYCMHWSYGQIFAQVINTATGRDYEGDTSNLCKVEMMRLFKHVMSSDNLTPRTSLPPNAKDMTYAKLKALATDYQEVKYLLMTGFHKINCGAWVGKPDEVDQFVCPDDLATFTA